MKTKITAFGKSIEVNAPQAFGFSGQGLVEDLSRALVRLEFSVGEAGEPVCAYRSTPLPEPVDSAPQVYFPLGPHEHMSDLYGMFHEGSLMLGRSLADINKDLASTDSMERVIVMLLGLTIDKRVEETDSVRHYIFTVREGTGIDWKIGEDVFLGSALLRDAPAPRSTRAAKEGDTRNTLKVFGETIEIGQPKVFHFRWGEGLVENEKESTFRLTFFLSDEGLPVCTSEGNAFAVCFAQQFTTARFFHSDAVFAGSLGCERAIVLCGGEHIVEKLAVRTEDGVDHYEFVLKKGAPFDFFAHEMPRHEVLPHSFPDFDEPYWRRYY